MPAVNPTRLRFQIEDLMQDFGSPPEFHRKLQDIFGLYANRALRYGDSTEIKPLIPMYNLPAPAIRQLQLDLDLRVAENPDAALALADELWQDQYYEVKQTALYILGIVPFNTPEPIIERLNNWLSPDLDAVLITSLFTLGTKRIQNIYPIVWERFISSFLDKNEPENLAIGIRGLNEGLKNKNFSNLPAVFRLISPIIQRPNRKNLHDLEDLIETLAALSATETGHFLRQALSVSSSPETKRLVKQCLNFFPEAIAQDLKSLVN
jgi:hypothetical protein